MMVGVPFGTFLSGGVNSSIIVSTIVSNSSKPVKTFTIGNSEDGCNNFLCKIISIQFIEILG